MAIKLTDLLQELAIALPIILEVEAVLEKDAPVGTKATLPAVHVRIHGRRIKLGPFPAEIEG